VLALLTAGVDKISGLARASYFTDRLAGFAAKQGVESVFPPQYFWGDDGVIVSDDVEIMTSADLLVITAVHTNVPTHSNHSPFMRWGVRFPIGDGESDVDWFYERPRAENFVAGFNRVSQLGKRAKR